MNNTDHSSLTTPLPHKEGLGESLLGKRPLGESLASYKTAAPDRYAILKEFARKNRKESTLAETILWEYLRKGIGGEKFLRQHIIGDYIVDFLSRHGGLIIEVDGGYHSEPRQEENDAIREDYLENLGYHVIRFTNEEVLNDIDTVLNQIEHYFDNEQY